MSWANLLDLIASVVGQAAAEKIEHRAMREMAGTRLTIAGRPTVTQSKLAENPGKPREAAKRIGVHPSTVYRRIVR